MRPGPILAALALSAGPVLADTPRVVTDIPVTQGLVQAIAGNDAKVTVLLEGASDPHSFQMRPSQARALADADLVIWVGAELTPWLARALEANAADVPTLALLEADGVYLREIGEDGHDHGAHSEAADMHDAHGHDDHGDEDHAHGEDDHAHEEHEHEEHAHGEHADDGHGHDDHAHEEHAHEDHAKEDGAHDEHDDAHAHDHDGIDPHAWLDPANARLWTGVIATALEQLVPSAAGDISARAETLSADIGALESELTSRLAPIRERHLVFQHDAYGYLTGHFGLEHTSAIADVDGVDPGAGHVSELAAASDIACVFGEVGQNQRLPERLARDLDTGFAVLDPTGADVAPGPGHYRDLMTGLVAAMTDCAAPQG